MIFAVLDRRPIQL